MRRFAVQFPRCNTLRSSSKEREASFMESRRATLFRNMIITLVGIIFCLCIVLVLSIRSHVKSHYSDPWSPENVSLFLPIMLGEVVILILCILSVYAARSHVFLLERVTIFILIVLAVLILVNDRYYSAQLLGYHLPENASDGRVLLALDTLITVSHLTLPLRWCILLPLEVLTPIIYVSIAIYFESPDGTSNVVSNTLILIFLSFMSSMGKRTAEMFERKAFADVIAEKSLRFQAEHKLSLSMPDTRADDSRQPRSGTASSATFDLSSLSVSISPLVKEYAEKGTQVNLPLQNSKRPPVPPDWPRDSSGRQLPPLAVSLGAQQQRKSRRRRGSHSAPAESRDSSHGTGRCVVQSTGVPTLKQFERTSSQAAELACEEALLHLNVSGVGCCSYHLSVTALAAATERMSSLPCSSSFQPHAGWQCAACKAMNDLPDNEGDDAYCDLCWQIRSTTETL